MNTQSAPRFRINFNFGPLSILALLLLLCSCSCITVALVSSAGQGGSGEIAYRASARAEIQSAVEAGGKVMMEAADQNGIFNASQNDVEGWLKAMDESANRLLALQVPETATSAQGNVTIFALKTKDAVASCRDYQSAGEACVNAITTMSRAGTDAMQSLRE